MKPSIWLLITDLDDTIWYWFKMWYASFSAELDELKRVTGIGDEILIPQIKQIHERHRTSEYAFLLQELPCLKARFGDGFDPKEKLPSVIAAFRKARKANTGLYPDVLSTLSKFHAAGARIVAFTESQRYYSEQRIKRCELDGVIDVLYATPESENIDYGNVSRAREHDDEWYSLEKTLTVPLPPGIKKPDPEVLKDILRDERCPVGKAIYVGDTLSKDILMANQAGVISAHAKYGEAHRQVGYDLLVKVTHWTSGDVQSQVKATNATVTPSFVLDRSFAQILDYVAIEPSPRI